MLFLYTLALYLLLPLVLLRLLWRSLRAPAYRRRWGERFGYFPPVPGNGAIWLHAVSVGEAVAAFPLVQRLRERHPGRPVVLTTTTPTGSERVRQRFGEAVHHGYLPYDLPGPVARFLDRTRPAVAVIMETEIWPNLYAACEARHVPVVLANARLSARSAAGYRRLTGLSAATLRRVSGVAAQSAADADRLVALGARAGRVRVTGNLKFDVPLPPGLEAAAAALRAHWGGRPAWIAASTHEGEDEQLLDILPALRRAVPDLLLALVPRHPERFARVAALCRTRGLRVVRRTEDRACEAATEVFLGDTMGELPSFYAAADVAFIGGSLVPTGGHNPLEAAALRLPAVFGPHMFNFAEISRKLVEAGGAVQVADKSELLAALTRLLQDPAQRAQIGDRAYQVVEDNRGALERVVEMVEEVMGNSEQREKSKEKRKE